MRARKHKFGRYVIFKLRVSLESLTFFSKFNKKHLSGALYNSRQESYYNITRDVVKDILLCDQKRYHACINSSQCNFKLWYDLNDKLNRLETEYAESNNF